ncbi:MAG: MotA/TolQ/ExbB proton channel family protein [Rikenellaceae bacterium]|nr:MotA/TolQ/ExbB proton channel family protein [Rikenellaceae bacterium]MCL2692553.1 MotA/TolQ/ExbB proton channel family protein [Rikenellaceae bacterium]
MKKLFLLLAAAGLFSFSAVNVFAQDFDAEHMVYIEEVDAPFTPQETRTENQPLHQVLKQKFIEGSVMWMSPLLLFLIIGLAVSIERMLYLNMATVNTKKLIDSVEEKLNKGDLKGAMEICRDTRGPVASIYYQGLMRYEDGLDAVEKAVVSYGSVQMGHMEKGLTWISLFIAAAPMVGFMGTVVGMIMSFDAIEMAGDINPALVAGGMKVALLTTMMALIAAVILQFFYNYILSKVDSLVITMEDSSITLIDMLSDYSKRK